VANLTRNLRCTAPATILSFVVGLLAAQLLGLNSHVYYLTTRMTPMPIYVTLFLPTFMTLYVLVRAWHGRPVPSVLAGLGLVALASYVACLGAYLAATLTMPQGVDRLSTFIDSDNLVADMAGLLLVVPLWLLVPFYTILFATADALGSRLVHRLTRPNFSLEDSGA
jgi:hypothetical protein